MSVIKVKVIDQSMIFTNAPVIASGGVGEDSVEFDFADDTWDGYVKTAMFFTSENAGYAALVNGNVAIIPAEAMASEGYTSFGLIGTNGSITRTSEVLRYNILRGANTVIVPAPTLDIYTQILDAVNAAVIPDEVREQNIRSSIKFWVGTMEEYNALTPVTGTMYIITDDGADYVVSTGTTDGWAWRKWANGRIEAEKKATVTGISMRLWGSVYADMDNRILLPSNLFRSVTVPYVAPTGTHSSYWVGGVTGTINNLVFTLYSPIEPTDATCDFVARVIGTYK